MGGGIALRIMTVSDAVDAAVLYGSMSGDEYLNYERILEWSGGERGGAFLGAGYRVPGSVPGGCRQIPPRSRKSATLSRA